MIVFQTLLEAERELQMSDNELTEMEKALEQSQDAYSLDDEQLSGFAFYQAHRDEWLSQMFDQGLMALYGQAYNQTLKTLSHPDTILFIHPAYIDNLLMSIFAKFTSPESYDFCAETFDKYIRPPSHFEGLEYIYKNAAAYLVNVLKNHKDASGRQSYHLAAQLFNQSNSKVEEAHTELKRRLAENCETTITTPSLISLIILFWCLSQKRAENKSLEPISQERQGRSVSEFDSTVSLYKDFKKDTFNKCISSYEQIISSGERTMYDIARESEDFDLSCMDFEEYPEIPTETQVFYMLVIHLFTETMPNYMFAPDKYISIQQ